MPERPDHFVYSWLPLYRETIKFYLEGVKFYEHLLEDDIKILKEDPNISLIFDDEILESLPLQKELERAKRVRAWLPDHLNRASGGDWMHDVSVSHGTVRFLKSTAQLYLQQLKQRRNSIGSRPNISRYALEALDTRISELDEKARIGVFAEATPMPLLVDQSAPPESPPAEASSAALVGVSRPRPVVMGSIELFDRELRARCLDLFEAFRSDGNTDRLETVLSEASRILENRIRSAARLPADCVGLDLASRAFGGASPILRVSNVANEQDAAHLLFRGVFAFIRNHVQHSSLAGCSPSVYFRFWA